jgi:hypothetical protein
MEMKSYLSEKKILLIRNFPDSVKVSSEKMENKRWRKYLLFFTTDTNNNKIVLICTKKIINDETTNYSDYILYYYNNKRSGSLRIQF